MIEVFYIQTFGGKAGWYTTKEDAEREIYALSQNNIKGYWFSALIDKETYKILFNEEE